MLRMPLLGRPETAFEVDLNQTSKRGVIFMTSDTSSESAFGARFLALRASDTSHGNLRADRRRVL